MSSERKYILFDNLPNDLTFCVIKLNSEKGGFKNCICCNTQNQKEQEMTKLTIGLQNINKELVLFEDKRFVFYLCDQCEKNLASEEEEMREDLNDTLNSLCKLYLSGISKNFESITFAYMKSFQGVEKLNKDLTSCKDTIEMMFINKF